MILIPLSVGLLTIAGWAFSIDILNRPLYSHIAMNPVTAVCFILCSIAFFLDFKRPASGMVSVISAQMSVSVALIGMLRLVGILGLDLHADSWLFHDAMIAAAKHGTMSHMTTNSALGFILMGSALRFGIVSDGRAKMICSGIALGAFVIGLSAFMGHLYYVGTHHENLGYIPMSFLTTICFICLSISFIIENTDNVFAGRTFTSFDRLLKA